MISAKVSRQTRDIATLILDGMERRKFALPKWPWGRTPKDAEKYHRPVLELTGCICHGHGVYLYLADGDVSIGANWHATVLLRSLEFLRQSCSRRGEPLPQFLSVHSDNTTSAQKNHCLNGLLASLASAGYFRCCSQQHLRVGHSHEDIDALFGVIANLIVHAPDLQCPQDVVECPA